MQLAARCRIDNELLRTQPRQIIDGHVRVEVDLARHQRLHARGRFRQADDLQLGDVAALADGSVMRVERRALGREARHLVGAGANRRRSEPASAQIFPGLGRDDEDNREPCRPDRRRRLGDKLDRLGIDNAGGGQVVDPLTNGRGLAFVRQQVVEGRLHRLGVEFLAVVEGATFLQREAPCGRADVGPAGGDVRADLALAADERQTIEHRRPSEDAGRATRLERIALAARHAPGADLQGLLRATAGVDATTAPRASAAASAAAVHRPTGFNVFMYSPPM